jgi:hypothetical protein
MKVTTVSVDYQLIPQCEGSLIKKILLVRWVHPWVRGAVQATKKRPCMRCERIHRDIYNEEEFFSFSIQVLYSYTVPKVAGHNPFKRVK